MIRRTRSEIEKVYSEDLKAQGLEFPNVNDPKKLVYEFSEETLNAFETTIQKISKITYARYAPLTFIKPGVMENKINSLKIGQMNMAGFICAMLK